MSEFEAGHDVDPNSLHPYARSYVVAIHLLLSFIWLRNKGFIFLNGMAAGQFLLAALKLDGVIDCSWVVALFILCMIVVFLLAATVFVVVFAVVSLLVITGLPPQKKCGFVFIAGMCLGMGASAAMPFYHLVLGVSFWIGAAVTLILNCVLVVMILKCKRGIIIFFCRSEEVKAYDQHVTIAEVNPSILARFQFEQLSENWLKVVKPSSKRKTGSNKLAKPLKENRCLACTENAADVAWIPCGHLAICLPCCLSMFRRKNATCILCKATASLVLVLEQVEEIEKGSQEAIAEHSTDGKGPWTFCAK